MRAVPRKKWWKSMKNKNHNKSSRWLFGAGLIYLGSLSLVHAADVAFYGVGKKQIYEQSGDSVVGPASGDAYAFTAFAIPSSADSLLFVTVTPPGSVEPEFLDSNNTGFELEDTYATLAELNSAAPSGQYTLTAQSSDFTSTAGPAALSLSGDTYPNTPQISNFTAAGAVDPTQDFVVNWNALDNAGPNDFVELRLKDDSGDVVFDTGAPGQPSALPGTARSAAIPANTLSSGGAYDAALTFGRITSRDTADYPGAVGVTTYAQETRFTLITTGDSGGGPSAIPPILMLTSPFNGAQNVTLDSPVVFTFTTPMAPAQSIIWSPNVTAANFTYTWGPGATNLTAKYNTAFPANTTITWALDPSVFKSQSGASLLAFNLNGSFTTGSGQSNTNNPCEGGSTNSGMGSLSLFKSVHYLQTSASPPVLDTESGAAVMAASMVSPATNPVTQVSLQLPGGAIKPLTNLFGTFIRFDDFPSEQALDAAYPAGNYTVTITRTTGAPVVFTLSVVDNAGAPPTPQIANFAQTQNFDPTSDLTVQWAPFTGAGARDSLFFDMSAGSGVDFHAPDICVPRELANTAVSIVVPGNTFGAGAQIDSSLDFTKLSAVDTNTAPDITVFAGYSKVTNFKSNASGGSQPAKPAIENLTRLANGAVQFQLTGTAGATLTAEASADLKVWTPIMSALSPTGLLPVTDSDAASMPYRFYRAKAQ
jgi:hypothetical protein